MWRERDLFDYIIYRFILRVSSVYKRARGARADSDTCTQPAERIPTVHPRTEVNLKCRSQPRTVPRREGEARCNTRPTETTDARWHLNVQRPLQSLPYRISSCWMYCALLSLGTSLGGGGGGGASISTRATYCNRALGASRLRSASHACHLA